MEYQQSYPLWSGLAVILLRFVFAAYDQWTGTPSWPWTWEDAVDAGISYLMVAQCVIFLQKAFYAATGTLMYNGSRYC